jgi:DNA repair exonuclease SbcCD ATPase subunit
LINAINEKKCLVEIDFSVGQYEYLVRRGMRPNVFEIWKNGTLINQDSHNKEYQKFLEQNILKLNHKSFHQVVVLGSSSFVPFMQLPTGARREVIEDLLDISVFSRMNVLLKEKQARLKDDMLAIDYEITLVENKIEGIQKNIANIESVNEEVQQQTREKLAKTKKEYQEMVDQRDSVFVAYTEKRTDYEKEDQKLRKKLSQFAKLENKMVSELTSISRNIGFYENNDDCPSCGQELSDEVKQKNIEDQVKRKNTLEETLEKMQAEAKRFQDESDKLNSVSKELTEQREKIQQLDTSISIYAQTIENLNNEIGVISGSKELEEAREDLQRTRNELFAKKTTRSELDEESAYQRVIAEMLKDSGIKTKIIKEYIPVINKLVNTYLEALGFYVKFELDETFKEMIKSRHRDEFTYDSFSEGEKTKIDVALLFAWRYIAQMKNSLSTNLLILDETFDSSLDNDGIENLMNLIRTFKENTNIFVISHKAEVRDRFDQTLVFRKENNFSTYDII